MEEAFASFQLLASGDMRDRPSSSEDVQSKLRYCCTDDTHAFNHGKSTEEEVEHYLEMQREMDGTSSLIPPVERLGTVGTFLDIHGDIEKGETNDDDSSKENNSYPWRSINPILRLCGPVASGYGRGRKQLGVPTANLPATLFQSALEDITNGVYFGWAVIEQPPQQQQWQRQGGNNAAITTKKGRNVPVKAVVNVGYSPTFEEKENKERIVEAHLITKDSPMSRLEERVPSAIGDSAPVSAIDDEEEEDVVGGGENTSNDNNVIAGEIEGDFYNETIRLQLIGYLRVEQKFNSFPDLIKQIHCDIGNAHRALDTMPFVFSKEVGFVKDVVDWIGSGGGNGTASWEYETW